MVRHPGNFLARPTMDEVVSFYSEKFFHRIEWCFPPFARKLIRMWILVPEGVVHRMLTFILLSLQFLRMLTRQVSVRQFHVPALPVYAMSGATIAFALVLAWAHWPAPAAPLNINELLLARMDSAQNANVWADSDPSQVDEYIPPELYPVASSLPDPQVIASIGSLNRKDSGSDLGSGAIASIYFKNNAAYNNKEIKPQLPLLQGVTHIIRSGESFSVIAKAYGVKCDMLERYNPTIDPRRMKLGGKVLVPGAGKAMIIPRRTPMSLPVRNGWVISGFGMRKHPLGGNFRFHRGIDIPEKTGTPVRAVMDGVVIEADKRGSAYLGRCVKIKHSGGYVTVYGHNSKILVKVGDKVKEGRIISRVGSTGRSTAPHLHFGVSKNGKYVDPEKYLPRMSHKRPQVRVARR